MERNTTYITTQKEKIYVEQLTIEELYRQLTGGFEEISISDHSSRGQHIQHSL